MKTSITYAITCCNELQELTTLLNFLQLRIREEDEILIQYDSDSVTQEVLDYITLMDEIHSNHTVVGFPLNGDFSSFKNNLKKHSTKDYIFQLDADEIPHEYLVEVLGELLDTNPVDLIFVPRINTTEGLTESHVKQWGWKVTKLESDVLIREKEMDTESEEYKLLKKYDLIIEEKSI